MHTIDLSRFVEAQKDDFTIALNEIKSGRKISHWMWYIFPQIAGLGKSSTSIYFSIKNIQEAEAYLMHPILGIRLVEISTALLKLATQNPIQIFGNIDAMKLQSSMTLFALLNPTNPVFQQVLDKYFAGKMDEKTKYLLGN
ncbi:MAG TPA: DUF1810 domain-containing protein [Chitinophagales bacterium]|nr:DUF1810 domain-containing protein [Chitinophagales bacterium]HQW79819.1 DUF1810 domain-containing protein [Chitinophagales bacterium]HRB19087.1 DUF1810 domain-containing protein [Chitinophagales bacterium]HRB67355.1 DUF1810 domain-containing protein [Chitinophagales bacterium]HRB70101.1 DUF1810 domain-containing protein [Chitinophagales bacterium]